METANLQFIVKNDPDLLVDQFFRRTPVGLVARQVAVPPLHAFELLGLVLNRDQTQLMWQFGDWAVMLAATYGQQVYEKLAAQLLTDRQTRTVEDWAYVCRGCPLSIRREGLSFNHHRQVVPMRDDPGLQSWWLEKGEREEWSVSRLREEIARDKGEPAPPTRQDRLFEFEMENARLSRELDNAIRERETALGREQQAVQNSERSESILTEISDVLRRLVSLGPDGVLRDPVETYNALLGALETIERAIRK